MFYNVLEKKKKKATRILNPKTFFLLLFLIILFIAPVYADDTSGTASVGDAEPPIVPSAPGTRDEPIVFDLFVESSDYIVLPFSSSVTTTIEAYNRVGRDAEVMFVWSILDSDNEPVKNGSFLYLVLGYQTVTIDVEVPVVTKEGEYVLKIDVPEIDVTGSSTYPFTVYSIVGYLLGPGIWIPAIIVILICSITFGYWLIHNYT